jgi:hypothetical protein
MSIRRASARWAASTAAAVTLAVPLATASAAAHDSATSHRSATPEHSARPVSHVGRAISVKRIRIVSASKLPPPVKGKLQHEPDETKPVRKGVRTTGIVRLKPTKATVARQGTKSPFVPDITEPVSFTGLGPDGEIPPDTQIAVSGSWVVEEENRAMDIFLHDGTLAQSIDLGTLFTGTPGGTDPKIVYDQTSHTFFSTYLIGVPGSSGATDVDLAVTSNPRGTWTIYGVHRENRLQDQPKLGFSSDKVLISWNDNGNSGPEEYVVLKKASLVAGAASVPGTTWSPDGSRLNLIPAVQFGSGRTAFAIYHNYNTSSVGVLAFTGLPGVSPVSFTDNGLVIAHTTSPPSAAQPGQGKLTPRLDTGDDRLESAVWSGGNLWAAGNDRCQSAADTTARSCLRVLHISTGLMRVIRDVDITMLGGDVMYPAVMLDAQGNLWLAFSSSSAHQFASSEVAEAPGGTIGGSIGAVNYQTGSGLIDFSVCAPDAGPRFGDYSGIALDPPPGPQGIWAATEFGSPSPGFTCDWATQVAEFSP